MARLGLGNNLQAFRTTLALVVSATEMVMHFPEPAVAD